MQGNYSRLQRSQSKNAKRNTYLLLAGSVIALILLATFGIKAVFGLTGFISGLRHSGSAEAQETTMIIPSQPQFIESFSATKSASITLTGLSDPKTTVEILHGERSLGTTDTNDDGKFKMEVALEKGSNIFSAVATSESGGKSNTSDSYTIRLLTGAPKLELTNLKEGDSFKDNPLAINGMTDPDNSVVINDHLAIVSGTGNFSYVIQLNDGENKLKIVAKDEAGNETTKEITIKYEK